MYHERALFASTHRRYWSRAPPNFIGSTRRASALLSSVRNSPNLIRATAFFLVCRERLVHWFSALRYFAYQTPFDSWTRYALALISHLHRFDPLLEVVCVEKQRLAHTYERDSTRMRKVVYSRSFQAEELLHLIDRQVSYFFHDFSFSSPCSLLRKAASRAKVRADG